MRRLIVSFIGGTDLRCGVKGTGAETSPIVRLLTHLGSRGGIAWSTMTLMLLDDTPDSGERARFCEDLKAYLPRMGMSGMQVELHPVILGHGPTDRGDLFDQVWDAIPSPSTSGFDEYIFHLSSGTPAMQTTLILAASTRPLPIVRLIETSREQGGVEVELPYRLGLRRRMERDRTPVPPSLPEKARKALQPNTVISHPSVESAYAVAFREARLATPAAILIKGPQGSGKRHLAHQYACWRQEAPVEIFQPMGLPAELSKPTVLLVQQLEDWSDDDLRTLDQWRTAHPGVSIAATLRTDCKLRASLEAAARHMLPGAAVIELPSLGVRSDVVEVAQALARELGIADGKIFERFQFDLLSDAYVNNLDDLKTLIATAQGLSKSALHPDVGGLKLARRTMDAERARSELEELFRGLVSLDFGGADHRSLSERLERIELLAIKIAMATGHTQQQVADILKVSQDQVSRVLRRGSVQ